MKKLVIAMSVAVLLLLALPKAGFALNIDIGDFHIGTDNEPPPLQITGQPELLPIPGRYAYFIPDTDTEIYYYQGQWYRPYKGRWFRSESYNGRWYRIRDVPSALIDLPSDYRSSSSQFDPIPYGDLGNNWERWEREKYWDRRRIELPPFQITGQPELLPIPGKYVYFVSDIDLDIYFYHGKWYRPYKDHWFIAANYNGPWDRIRDVPPALIDLPRDYKSSSPRGYYPVPYGELSDNWERWEREKYWDRSRDEERERLGRRRTPPPFEITGQPKLYPIPGKYVYFVSDIDVDIYFYHGKWYRPYKDRWFIAANYNGPWDRIRDVPASLQDLPRWYNPVPYGELRDNWERWEREKYWDRSRDEERERHPEQRGKERY